MNDRLRAYFDGQAHALAESVRQALEIAHGDAVAALRTVMIANIFLHEENERLRQQISTGFTRGGLKKVVR